MTPVATTIPFKAFTDRIRRRHATAVITETAEPDDKLTVKVTAQGQSVLSIPVPGYTANLADQLSDKLFFKIQGHDPEKKARDDFFAGR